VHLGLAEDPEILQLQMADTHDRQLGSKPSSASCWPGLSTPEKLAFALSRHQVLRKTLAMRPDLPGEIVEILARDESFPIQVLVCRNNRTPRLVLAQRRGMDKLQPVGHARPQRTSRPTPPPAWRAQQNPATVRSPRLTPAWRPG
jgi:hypothetical protein